MRPHLRSLALLLPLTGTLSYTLHTVPVALRNSRQLSMTAAYPVPGDVITVNYALRPAAEPSTYNQGRVSFVLGGGNYLLGLHDTVATMRKGDALTAVPIDAGFGEYSQGNSATLDISQAPAGLKTGMAVMLQVTTLPGPACAAEIELRSTALPAGAAQPRTQPRHHRHVVLARRRLCSPRVRVVKDAPLQVPGGKQRALVTEMTNTSFTLDANHPLAGKTLDLDVEVRGCPSPDSHRA